MTIRQESKRALVADPHALSAVGICHILETLSGLSQTEYVSDFPALCEALRTERDWDIVLIDPSLAGIDGLRGVAAIRENFPDNRIAVVSQKADRMSVLDAIAVGVHGYIPKTLSAQDMAEAFRAVIAGHIFVPDSLADIPASRDGEDTKARPNGELILTARQQDVMKLLRQGHSNKEIAHFLYISESTVKVHMAAAFRRLGVHNRVGAISALDNQSRESVFEHIF